MSSQQYSLVRRYERFFLQPLQVGYWIVTMYFFWHRAWMLGITLALLSFVVAMIGASLPHHKGQSAREIEDELATGENWSSALHNQSSDDDAHGIAEGALKTFVLLDFTAFILLWHEGWKWYWILLSTIAAWPLFLIVSLSLAAVTGLTHRHMEQR